MEAPINAIIAVHGLKVVARVIKNNRFEQFEPLVDTVRLAHQMQLDGCQI